MPSNDKISLMTAAVAADVGGSAGRIEMTKAYATVPTTLGLDFQVLRTSMFAGSTGYTATDPITAGAASFTTLAASSTLSVTGNVAVNTNKFTITAASGNTAVAGTLAVTGASTLTGNVGIGGAASGGVGLYVRSAALTGTIQSGLLALPVFSSAATNSGYGMQVGVSTAAAAFTMTTAYGIAIAVPTLGAGSAITTNYGVYVGNQGAADITNSYGLFVAGQSGSLTNNYAIYAVGTSWLQGEARFGSSSTAYTAQFYTPQTTVFGTNVNAWMQNRGFANDYAQIGFGYNSAGAQVYPSSIIGAKLTTGGSGKTDLVFATRDVTTDTAAIIRMTINTDGTVKFENSVGIGGVPNSGTGLYLQSAALAGVTQHGVYSYPVGTSGATSAIIAVRGKVGSAVAAFTSLEGIALFADVPVLGAGSAITTQYGLYSANQGKAGITNAYGVYIDAQSGAATTNIGLYNAGTTTLAGALTTNGGLMTFGANDSGGAGYRLALVPNA